MLDGSHKKAIILCVLKVLEQYSDANHPLTQEKIAELIKSEFNFAEAPDRKTIASYLKILKEGFGYRILSDKVKKEKVSELDEDEYQSGSYLDKTIFDDMELKLLVSNIATAKFLSPEQAKEIIADIMGTDSRHSDAAKRVGLLDDYIRTNNDEMFLNLKVIDRAIKTNSQISFVYNDLDINGKLVPRITGKDKDGKYRFHPYATLCYNGNFYLIGSTFDYNQLRHYRIDRITSMKLIEASKRTPLSKIEECKDKGYIDLSLYAREHLNMWNGRITPIIFKADKSIMNYIWDSFGEYANIREVPNEPDKVIFKIMTAIDGAKVFAKQFCTACEVLEPVWLRDELRQEFKVVAEKYMNKSGEFYGR